MKMSVRVRVLALLAVVALVAAACGSDNDQGAPEAPLFGAEEPAVLPPNPNPGDTPATSGACLEDEPDCNDMIVPDEEPIDLPLQYDGEPVSGPTSGGVLVDGGLTVTDALASDAAGIIAIKGQLLISQDGARLCEGFAESAPPQCAFASVPITGFEEVLSIPLASSQGISWTDQAVSFLGVLVDGTFVVDPTVSQ